PPLGARQDLSVQRRVAEPDPREPLLLGRRDVIGTPLDPPVVDAEDAPEDHGDGAAALVELIEVADLREGYLARRALDVRNGSHRGSPNVTQKPFRSRTMNSCIP